MYNQIKHYIRINENKHIVHGFSTAFEQPLEIETDICIYEGGARHFTITYIDPLNNEIVEEVNPSLKDENGIHRFKQYYNKPTFRTDEEKQLEYEAKSILTNKLLLSESISKIRREQLQTEFTYDGHRQSYNNYDQAMRIFCQDLFIDDVFLSDSSLWKDASQPSIYWTWTDYDDKNGGTLVTSSDYFKNMHSTWFIREQKARIAESTIESEIELLESLDEINNYDVLKRFKQILGEI